jgi:nucleotide-binding universal stress UspA family protein
MFFRVLTLPPLTWNLQTVPNFDGLQSQMSDACLDYLEELRKKHAVDGLKIECQFSIGAAADEILALSEKCPHSMVVMATHGRDGLQRWMLGSVAERVARHAPCPVLLVRTDLEEKKDA